MTGSQVKAVPNLMSVDALLASSQVGARILTVRGLLIRCIGAAASFALLGLVGPVEYGLLTVIRAAAATLERIVEFGLTMPLLTQREEPTHEQYGALASAQWILIIAALAVIGLWPGAPVLFGLLDTRWRYWMLTTLATTIVLPLGTGARIRLERRLQYGRIGVLETSAVVINLAILTAFTVAGRLLPGVFVAQILSSLFLHVGYYLSARGPLTTTQLGSVVQRLQAAGGFTVAYIVGIVRDQSMPLVVAGALGVPSAGVWGFGARLAEMIQFSYEGFSRVGMPAAARLADNPFALRRLIASLLDGAAAVALPAATLVCVTVPVVALLLPQWREAVPIAQIFVLCATASGVVAAALGPVAAVRRGWPAILAAHLVPVITSWSGLLLLRWWGRDDLWVVIVSTEAMAIGTLLAINGADQWPGWSPARLRAAATVVTGLAVAALGRLVGAHPVVIAALGTAGVMAWVISGRPTRSPLAHDGR